MSYMASLAMNQTASRTTSTRTEPPASTVTGESVKTTTASAMRNTVTARYDTSLMLHHERCRRDVGEFTRCGGWAGARCRGGITDDSVARPAVEFKVVVDAADGAFFSTADAEGQPDDALCDDDEDAAAAAATAAEEEPAVDVELPSTMARPRFRSRDTNVTMRLAARAFLKLSNASSGCTTPTSNKPALRHTSNSCAFVNEMNHERPDRSI